MVAVAFAAGVASAATVGTASWEPPRTTRRYVHPPMAERMCVLFNDAKLMLSEVRHEHNWTTRDYNREVGNVLWFFQGKDDRLFDFKKAENLLPDDGVPLHGLRWREDGVAVTLETCCDFVRRTTAHGRFSVANGGTKRFAEEYAIRVRYGNESTLLGGYKKQPPDYYSPYKSVPETWSQVLCDWTWSDGVLRSPAGGFVTFSKTPPSARWDAEQGELRFAVDLEPGASFDLDFAFGIGADVQPAFEATRRATADAWQRELARINRLPKALMENPEHLRIVRNMVVQMLQCFCHPVGCDYVMPRQGGLQRWVWPWDNMDALSALGKIGDFGEYVESAIDFYFGLYGYGSGGYPEPESRGRIGPFGNDWDCNTANCLGILARYCLDTGCRGPWDRYRAKALEGFRWIMRFRVPPGATDAVPGFFPVGWACDIKTKAQPWGFTDAINLSDMGDYLVAAERFGDPALAEIRAGFEDYLGTMRDRVLFFKQESADKEDFDIPISPNRQEVEKMYPRLYHGNMVVLGLKNGYLDAADVLRIWKWCLRNGQASANGLTGKYTTASDDPVMKHYWYTTSQDYLWHRAFREIGRNDLADVILAATLKFAMTRELYVGERYRDDEPWFLPWSPNCSGSGRIVQMLLERYGERMAPKRSALTACAFTLPEGMFPFLPSYDAPDNVVNMSHLLEAPAGKDGRIRVKGRHFVNDRGRVRFNATNLTGPANFPTHEEADRLVARLARFGINCVRLHYFDDEYFFSCKCGASEPARVQGILSLDPKTKCKLDPARQERMDYLVAKFKERGIYVDINLHVARTLDERDGVAPGTKWANKGIDQFDTRIIELEREYARDLLSHVNPYTGMSYLKDPVVALVELNNEDALWRVYRTGGIDKIAEPYASEFKGLWNKWLVRKYGAAKEVDGKSAAKCEVPIVKWNGDDPDDVLRRDFYDFISDTEHAYWAGMRDYLQKELGLEAPIAGTQLTFSSPHLQAELDFVDNHAYWRHPACTNDWPLINDAMINSRGGKIAFMAAMRVAGKPYTITEYNHPYPNFYGAEGQPMLRAYGALNGWDGVFQYSYNNSTTAEPDFNEYFFSMAARTDVLAHMPACAAMFLRGDVSESRAPVVVNMSLEGFMGRLVSTKGKSFAQGTDEATDGKVKAETCLARAVAIDVEGKVPPVSEPIILPKRIVSDTGELVWDNEMNEKGVWTVNTRNTKVFSGFPAGRTFDLGGVRIKVGETSIGWATVSLVSHDATGFGEDGRPARILLAATSLSLNAGVKFTEHEENKISCYGADWGHSPVVNEGVPASVTLPADASRVRCRALDEHGEPKAEVPVSADAAGRAVVLIGPEYRTVWYEIDVK